MSWFRAAVAMGVVAIAGAVPMVGLVSRAAAQTAPASAPAARLNTTVDEAFLHPRSSLPFQVRLSPDGKTILYRRPVGGAAEVEPGDPSVVYELVLQEVESGKETVLPTGPIPSGYDTIFTRFNCFDASGRSMVFARFTEAPPPDGDGIRRRPQMELIMYDIATATTRPTGVRGGEVMAKFDRTGKGLVLTIGRGMAVASLADLKVRPLAAPGFLQSVCPTADVVAVYAVSPPVAGVRKKRLVLYDLAADKGIRDIPIHERNSQLDDLETQWTADGRYLHYVDFRDNPANAKAPIPVTRVWDRVADKEAGVIDDAIAVGPGPTPTSMVLRRQEEVILHDAPSGRSAVIVAGPAKAEHAGGRRVAYSTTSAEGKTTLHVIDFDDAPTGRP